MKRFSVLIAVVLFSLVFSSLAYAETPINASWDNTYSSKYMFWGIPFSGEDVFQSMLILNHGPFTLFFFGNNDFQLNKFNEGDILTDYTMPLNSVLNTSFGYNYYRCKLEDWETYGEMYFGLSFNTLFSPSITYHNLFGFEEGNYIDIGLSKNLSTEKIPLLLSGKIGYNDRAFREKSGLSHTDWGVSIPITIFSHLSMIPFARYSWALSDDFKNELYGGLTSSWKF
jgi:hypothetical protein